MTPAGIATHLRARVPRRLQAAIEGIWLCLALGSPGWAGAQEAPAAELAVARERLAGLAAELQGLENRLAVAQDSLAEARRRQARTQRSAEVLRAELGRVDQQFAALEGELERSRRTLREYRRTLGGAAFDREVLARYNLGVVEAGRLDAALLDRLSAGDRQQLYEDLTGRRDAYTEEMLLAELQQASRRTTVPFAQALAQLGGLAIKMVPQPSAPGVGGPIAQACAETRDLALTLYQNSLAPAQVSAVRPEEIQRLQLEWGESFGEQFDAVALAAEELDRRTAAAAGLEDPAALQALRLELFENQTRQLERQLGRLHESAGQHREQILQQIRPVVQAAETMARQAAAEFSAAELEERGLHREVEERRRERHALELRIYNLEARARAALEADAFAATSPAAAVVRILAAEIEPDERDRAGGRVVLADERVAGLYPLPARVYLRGLRVLSAELRPRTERILERTDRDGREVWKVRRYFDVSFSQSLVAPTAQSSGEAVLVAGDALRAGGPGQATVTLSVPGIANMPGVAGQRLPASTVMSLEQYQALEWAPLSTSIDVDVYAWGGFVARYNSMEPGASLPEGDEQEPSGWLELFQDEDHPRRYRIDPLFRILGPPEHAANYRDRWDRWWGHNQLLGNAPRGRLEFRNLAPGVIRDEIERGFDFWVTPLQPGSGSVRFELDSPTGEAVASAELPVHFGYVQVRTADDEEHVWQHRADKVIGVPADEPLELLVEVAGDADMRQYYCRWTANAREDLPVELRRAQTRFERGPGGNWVSRNTVRYPLDSYARGDHWFRTEIAIVPAVPEPGRRFVQIVSRQIDVFPPRVERFHIRAKRDQTPGAFVRAAAYDLFYPGGARARLLLRAHSESVTGAGADISGYPGLQYRLSGDENVFSLSRGTLAPRAAPGRATLAATLTRSPQQVYFLRQGETRLLASNEVEVTCNVLELQATDGGYRLAVSGPADMTRYVPVWQFESGEELPAAFAAAGAGRWLCEVARPQFDYRAVRLLDPDGQVAAEYAGRSPRVPAGGDGVRQALIGLFAGYEREDAAAVLEHVSPAFRSADTSGTAYGLAELEVALTEDFRSLNEIEFAVDAEPPVGDAERVRLNLRWNRRATLAVTGQEWVLRDRASVLAFGRRADGSGYWLESVEGDPLFGISGPSGRIEVPAGSVLDGVPVAAPAAVVEGGLGPGGGGGPLQPFAGFAASIPLRHWTDGTIHRWFAGLELDARAGTARLRDDGGGNALIVQTPPDVGAYRPGEMFAAFPDRLVKDWEFTPPSPPGGPGVAVEFPPSTPQTVWLRSVDPPKTVRVMFVATPATEGYVLTVSEVTVVE